MGLFTGKTGIIMGVANDRSIAAGVAKFIHSEGCAISVVQLSFSSGRQQVVCERFSMSI